jgi:small subunit ribosomal protein S16
VTVKIKLKRMGKTRNPQYRIVVADARTARSGRAIEEIGIYQPRQEPSLIRVDSERAQYWLGVGAQPTESVEAILKVTGDWQKFRGDPGAEGSLRVAEPKPSKQQLFEEALRSADEAGRAASRPAREARPPAGAKEHAEPAAAATEGAVSEQEPESA